MEHFTPANLTSPQTYYNIVQMKHSLTLEAQVTFYQHFASKRTAVKIFMRSGDEDVRCVHESLGHRRALLAFVLLGCVFKIQGL